MSALERPFNPSLYYYNNIAPVKRPEEVLRGRQQAYQTATALEKTNPLSGMWIRTYMHNLNMGNFLNDKGNVGEYVNDRIISLVQKFHVNKGDYYLFSYDEITAGIVQAVMEKFTSRYNHQKFGLSDPFVTQSWQIVESMEDNRLRSLRNKLGIVDV